MRRTTAARFATAAIVTALLCACSGPTRFVDPEADMPYYETVAIVPFTTLAQDRAAGLRVTDVFYGELLRRDFALVLEPGQFDAAMRKVRGGTPVTNAWSQAELSRLGEETGIQGIFMGTVRDYEMVREGRKSFPLVCLEVRLVDTGTGRVVWSASDTQKGGPGFPIFGFGETHTLGEMTAKVCQALLSTLP